MGSMRRLGAIAVAAALVAAVTGAKVDESECEGARARHLARC